eukprot:980734-Prorocentrum_minimum.AAC.2
MLRFARLNTLRSLRTSSPRYADIGEEEDWTTAQDGDEDEPVEDRKRKAEDAGKASTISAAAPKAKKKPEVKPGEARRLHGMFAAAARAGAVPTANKPAPKVDVNADKCVPAAPTLACSYYQMLKPKRVRT